MNSLGDRVKAVMRTKGVVVDDICILTGKKQPTISSYLTGRTFPNEDFFDALIKLVPEINLHYIITGVGEPYFSESNLKKKVAELESREKQLTDTIIRMGSMLGTNAVGQGDRSKSKGVFNPGNWAYKRTVINTPWLA